MKIRRFTMLIKLFYLFSILLAFDDELSAQNAAGNKWVYQRTIMQLNSAFLYVVRVAGISIDSALILASRSHHMSRVPVITEGIDETWCPDHCQWMDIGKVDSIKSGLLRLQGADHARDLLLIGAYYAFQPGESNYRESIKFLLLAKSETEKLGLSHLTAESLCLLSKANLMLYDVASSKKWFNQLVSNPSFSGDTKILAKAWNYQDIYSPFLPDLNQYRIDCANKALQYYSQSRDLGNQINTLMNIAYMSFAMGKPQQSDTMVKRSLNLQESIHFPFTQYSYDLLAFLAPYTSSLSHGLQFALQAIHSAESTNDSAIIPHLYSRIVYFHYYLDNKENEEVWINKTMDAFIRVGGDPDLYNFLTNIGAQASEIKLGPKALNLIQTTLKKFPPSNEADWENAYIALGNCYQKLSDYPTSKHYLTLAWKLDSSLQKSKGSFKNSVLCLRIGQINYFTHDYDLSRYYLNKSLSPPWISYLPNMELLKAYYILHDIDSLQKDYKSALYYLALYNSLSQKIYNESESKQFYDLSIKYETLQKEKKLQALEAQNQLQELRDIAARRLFYAGFIFLGVIILLVFLRYRNNRIKNLQLSLQKEEIDKQNVTLQKLNDAQTLLLNEKEWLLREIHHRVKNNLQVVNSLLASQAAFLKDRTAIKAMKESQHRVRAMSLIHQKLYNSESHSSIYMPQYVAELVEYLKDSFNTEQKIFFQLDIEPLWLDVTKVIPLGLILNEVITNAFKYAFPYTQQDKISIKLKNEDNKITLIVEDNGRGLPENYNPSKSNSFGMTLMQGMAEDLEGNFTMENHHGTKITVTFDNSAVSIKANV
jgi:two-component system, sensor histidine kinase PdtaS